MHHVATRLSRTTTPTQGMVYVYFGSFEQLSHQVTVCPYVGWCSQQNFWHLTLIPHTWL